MFKALGLDPAQLMSVFGDVAEKLESALGDIRAEVGCLKDEAQATRRVLEYEYGRPVELLQGHDPRVLPELVQASPTANETTTINLRAVLRGKPATRGHILNRGNYTALCWFVREDAAERTRVGPYYLLANASLEITWALDQLEIQRENSANAVNIQVFVQ